MNLHDNHRTLFGLATALFVALTLLVAIIPAINNQRNNAPLPGSHPLTDDESAGKRLFIANGCVACHTQQVRNVAMDKGWGARPSIAADYARNERTDLWRNTATLMGTGRTGPDLTNVGNRQPSSEWHLLHLYNPRAVVADSIMPAYPWLFENKREPGKNDKVVSVPDAFKRGDGEIVATPEALQLVAYLQSLKQVVLPDGTPAPEFLYQRPDTAGSTSGGDANAIVKLDGGALYATYCQSCHQANGEGLKGAFPPLKGSSIVLDENPARLIDVIMKGYDARVSEGYAIMPPIGTMSGLKAEEIQAIINHERSSWGNNAPPVPLDEVKKLLQTK